MEIEYINELREMKTGFKLIGFFYVKWLAYSINIKSKASKAVGVGIEGVGEGCWPLSSCTI